MSETPPKNSSTVTQHYDPEMQFKGLDKTVTTNGKKNDFKGQISIKNSVPISKYHGESKVRQIEQKQQRNKRPSSKMDSNSMRTLRRMQTRKSK